LTGLTTQLQYLGVTVLPRPFSLVHAGKAFSDNGTLSPELLSSIDEMTAALILNLQKLKQD
jgi:hypothetical protein